MIERLKQKQEALEKEIAYYKELIAKATAKREVINEIIAEEEAIAVEKAPTENVTETVEVFADNVSVATVPVESNGIV